MIVNSEVKEDKDTSEYGVLYFKSGLIKNARNILIRIIKI
jgi:hypothetical protein